MTAVLLYAEFTRVTFLKMLAYRLRYYTGIVSYLVFVAGNTFLFRAIYAGLPPDATPGGFGVDGIVTYLAVSWVGRSLVFNNVDRELATLVAEGHIAQALTKPYHFQTATLFGAFGEMLFRLVLFTIPISCVVFPLFGVAAPPTPGAAAGGILSFLLAFAVNTQLNFLLGTAALRLKSILGLVRAKLVVSELLSGALVPLSFFPDVARAAAEALPFAAIGWVPVTIWMGRRTGPDLAWAIAGQIAWAAALWLAGAWAWRTGVRRTSVQGG